MENRIANVLIAAVYVMVLSAGAGDAEQAAPRHEASVVTQEAALRAYREFVTVPQTMEVTYILEWDGSITRTTWSWFPEDIRNAELVDFDNDGIYELVLSVFIPDYVFAYGFVVVGFNGNVTFLFAHTTGANVNSLTIASSENEKYLGALYNVRGWDRGKYNSFRDGSFSTVMHMAIDEQFIREATSIEDRRFAESQWNNALWQSLGITESRGFHASDPRTANLGATLVSAQDIADQIEKRLHALNTPSPWAADSISTAIAVGLVPETLQSSYTQATTRAEFAKLAVTLYEKVAGEEITGRRTFDDTNDINVQKAAYIGVVQGVGENMFSPNAPLNRAQAATMLGRLAVAMNQPLQANAPTFADNAAIPSWAANHVGQMQLSGIMGGTGDNMFTPLGNFTREQSIITILRLFTI